MKCELWYSARERSGVLLRQGDAASVELKSPDAQVIWTVDSKEYAVAAELCSALLHWGKRESGETQATIRLTIVLYLNRQGEQCRISVPGWVGQNLALLPGSEDVYLGLIDFLSLVVPDRSRILGYAYIERPSLVAFDGPTLVIRATKPLVLTVVTLRSTDGTEELAQEFYGRFLDSQEISRMVGERLGPEMSDWTIMKAQIHEYPKPPREKSISEFRMQPKDGDKYAGCRRFTSSGLTGFVLGKEGEDTGWLYDFFASPREEEGTAQEMWSCPGSDSARDRAARRLVTSDLLV